MKKSPMIGAAVIATMMLCGTALLHADEQKLESGKAKAKTEMPQSVPEVSVLSLLTGWAVLLLRRSRG